MGEGTGAFSFLIENVTGDGNSVVVPVRDETDGEGFDADVELIDGEGVGGERVGGERTFVGSSVGE